MKLLCLLAVAICFGGRLSAQPGALIELEIVAIPPAEAPALIPALQRSAAPGEARLRALLAAGDATLLGCEFTRLQAGTKAVASGTEEVRYFDGYIIGPSILSPHAETDPWWDNGVPTVIPSRLLGPSLEVTLLGITPAGAIDLNLEAQCVRFEKMDTWFTPPDRAHLRRIVSQPVYGTDRFVGPLRVRSGETTLLTVCIETRPAPRTVLFLLRATAAP